MKARQARSSRALSQSGSVGMRPCYPLVDASTKRSIWLMHQPLACTRRRAIMTTVSLSFAALTIDSADPAALADFWGKALGRPVSPGAVAGHTAVDPPPPKLGPPTLQQYPPKQLMPKKSAHP